MMGSRLVWQGMGWGALALAALGVVLPLLPTTPFVLLAVAAFGRGSPHLAALLEEHPRFGPAIADWRDRGAIGMGAKTCALVAMAASFALAFWADVPLWALAVQGGCLLAAAYFVASRPTA